MSDDSDTFFRAWKWVFGEKNTRKIICAWHLDRSRRKALAEQVKDKQEQKQFTIMLLNEQMKLNLQLNYKAF